MTNENHQNIHPVRNSDSNGTDKEIQEPEGRLKTLKEQSQGDKGNPYMIPMTILVVGVLIAGAVYFLGGKNNAPTVADNAGGSQQVPPAGNQQQPPQGNTAALDQMAPISAGDHIRGNPDAPVKIVEYSDTECPFCKRLHDTMKQITAEYGASGKVAWVYRHFPLDQLHPVKARNEAAAFECANELGGNDAFWAYADRLYEVTPSNNGLDPMELHSIAQYIGLDMAKFNTCLTSDKFAKHIEDDVQDAIATGGNGTPWSIVVAQNGKKYPLSGAQPYSAVKSIIELALKEK